jgi:ribose 5-phosphate isomerase A
MPAQDDLTRAAAEAAIAHVPEDAVIGVGTGSTVNFFIAALARMKGRIAGAVSSSEQSSRLLEAAGIPVLDLNSVNELAVYVDGADEVNEHLYMIKGGGGALTREKIVAAVARRFVCIVDESKVVDVLGRFPLPVEVIGLARSHVARQMVRLGGEPRLREGFRTDNGHPILDVAGMRILDPVALESEINQIAGVVCNGLFARRPADIALVAGPSGVRTIRR